MTNENRVVEFPGRKCLTDDDLYSYVCGSGTAETLSTLEAHLAECPDCRRNLAELLQILHPSDSNQADEVAPLSKAETDRTLAFIKEVARRERPTTGSRLLKYRIPAAAALFIAFTLASLWGLTYIFQTNKSRSFYAQARTILEENYAGTSPGNLRLSLPFTPVSRSRSISAPDSLDRAKTLFFQSLAIKDDLVEAHLGLACINLAEAEFTDARARFQKVLDIDGDRLDALLGRGVAQFEEGLQSNDPIQQDTLLKNALDDFNAVLELDPKSQEARYNKIWALFESGRHQEALQEIELYFSLESESTWADALRGLKVRIEATRFSAVQEKVNRAARTRDRAALLELAQQAPYQMPPAIWSAMMRSLNPESASRDATPDPQDLVWAAQVMESGYSKTTGDNSLKAFIDFYIGLSPPQRTIKKNLDHRFQELLKLHQNGQFALVLQQSESLESSYRKLRDFWQLVDLHYLRGSCYYLENAGFDRAEAEFADMLKISEALNSEYLVGWSLAALSVIYREKGEFDSCLACAKRLRSLGSESKLCTWEMYGCTLLGDQWLRVGKFEESLREYSAALRFAYRLLDGLKVIETLESLAVTMDRIGRSDHAQLYYNMALQQLDRLLENRTIDDNADTMLRRLNLLYNQGELALRTADLASAERLFSESLERSSSTGMLELEGRNRIRLAEVYLKTGRLPEARNMIRWVIGNSSSGRYPTLEWQARFVYAQLLESTGRLAQAETELKSAIAILEQIRRKIEPSDIRQSFFADRFAPYRMTVRLLYDSGRDRKEILEFVNRAKSITLKEHLSIPDAQAKTRQSSASNPILEYFFTDKGLLIFLVHGGRTEAVSAGVSKETISRDIDRYLASVQRNDSEECARAARLLYDQLLAPVEKHLFSDSDAPLIILPDGPLHLLPFAGLQDAQNRFLIEKTALVYSPSRSALMHCLAKGKQIPAERQSAVLIDGAARLAAARQELNYLSGLYGRNSTLLVPEDIERFRSAVATSNILHFSGHSVDIDGRPALLLQSSPRRIYLDSKTINSWSMPRSSLVNLAGCSTGTGPLSEGEGPWGLIPAFLNAGAPSIIASMMPVDDASTQRLSRSFYGRLVKGESKAKALQMAQLELLHSSPNNPRIWIPYFLLGNPQ